LKEIRIPNPHRSGDIHISLVKEILRQASISNNEWNKV
jgi:predicted RNA binding protein YcfA (HicA-like mRNA interferase family)